MPRPTRPATRRDPYASDARASVLTRLLQATRLGLLAIAGGLDGVLDRIERDAMNASLSHRLTITESMPVHDAHVLTAGGVQARIVLDGQVYSLRITKAGKLILTK